MTDHASRTLNPIAGILAIEVKPEGNPVHLGLPLESASALVDVISGDLLRLLPGVDACGLAIAAALYDQAQILRPGFPVHAALAELYGQEPKARQAPSLMAFGASAGRMAKPELEPDPRLIGSPFLVLPFVLMAPAEARERLTQHMETEWEEQALASARLALFLNQSFSIETEHVRFMTRNDLLALCAMQYNQADLEPLWQLLECALLSPNAEETVRSASGHRYLYRHGVVSTDPVKDAGTAQERRQYQAVLAAHGLQLVDAQSTDA
ncbi:hypothetical protein C7S18_21020 [Ahniella affigens]|uniref:Uncharacterized protein n=1 Tax=Ahniella affigens TaxID=2021234 RepID=A0A2P1PXE2_9GAMM|nr:hypothetical protein [Ahniella affigens]AVP99502.1 hypothetical protein C7S18_21020 [Ahniella affigens]